MVRIHLSRIKPVNANTYEAPVVLTCDFAAARSVYEQCVGKGFESSLQRDN